MLVGAGLAGDSAFPVGGGHAGDCFKAVVVPKGGHSKPVNLLRPFLAGPAGSPRSGTRLIGTGPKGHPVPAGPRFSIPENRPGRNPSLGV